MPSSRASACGRSTTTTSSACCRRASAEAGYRLYSYDDLARLREILIWRALGFSLAEIASVLDDPGHDRLAALERQRELVELMRAGEPADGPAARGLAERHREHISRWFYPCSPQMHRGLAEMYIADERFRSTYERHAEGLAAYFHDAIVASADAASAQPSATTR